MHKDEKKLKELLTTKTSKDFDKKFWNKFEHNFPKKKWFLNPVYALSLSFVLIISGSLYIYNQDRETLVLAQNDYELMQEYELINELDEEMIKLDDKEWEVLLAQI